jgi:hypothetical protein
VVAAVAGACGCPATYVLWTMPAKMFNAAGLGDDRTNKHDLIVRLKYTPCNMQGFHYNDFF